MVMAAFLALGKTLEENVIGTIFSFLDDSSLVINGSRDANDIGNLDDLMGFDYWPELQRANNRYMSIRMILDSMEQAAFRHQLV